MRWDWYDAPGLAPSLVKPALGAIIAAAMLSESRIHRTLTIRLTRLALLFLAATLLSPFLSEIFDDEDEATS
jgi:hypothetical protein